MGHWENWSRLLVIKDDISKGIGAIQSCVLVAGQIKPHVKVPMIGVGEVRDEKLVRKIEEDDVGDMLAIGRGPLADQYFVQKILEGRGNQNIRWKD